MKYFTPEACDTFDEIEPFRKVNEQYRRHLTYLRGILPEKVLELAEPSGMENALVVHVAHDRTRGSLRLVLRCGDLQMGYYNLVYQRGPEKFCKDAAAAGVVMVDQLPAGGRHLGRGLGQRIAQQRHVCGDAGPAPARTGTRRQPGRTFWRAAAALTPRPGRPYQRLL